MHATHSSSGLWLIVTAAAGAERPARQQTRSRQPSKALARPLRPQGQRKWTRSACCASSVSRGCGQHRAAEGVGDTARLPRRPDSRHTAVMRRILGGDCVNLSPCGQKASCVARAGGFWRGCAHTLMDFYFHSTSKQHGWKWRDYACSRTAMPPASAAPQHIAECCAAAHSITVSAAAACCSALASSSVLLRGSGCLTRMNMLPPSPRLMRVSASR